MTKIKISDLKTETGVGFGTSGVRDLIVKLTDKVVYCYTRAFLQLLEKLDQKPEIVAIAGDLRSSTKHIMDVVGFACQKYGIEIVNCGYIPTPALMNYGYLKKIPTIMVTGSHIPDDRNGIKFNLPQREILKSDEALISEMEIESDNIFFEEKFQLVDEDNEARQLYIDRFVNFFPKKMLKGKRIGLYGHTAVGRDIYVEILSLLGAEVIKFEYSEKFIPIDTDVVDEILVTKMKKWKNENGLDYILSTDGDGDRPLLADENGEYVRNDVMPILAAKYLGADSVACTINCNSMVDMVAWFKKVLKTKIGSPQVIEAMEILANDGYKNVVGYEGNGGFLNLNTVSINGKSLTPLPTRDAVITMLCVIAYSLQNDKKIGEILMNLPKRYTYFSSIKGIPTEKSLAILENWEIYRKEIEINFGRISDINQLDGLRLTFENGDIVHFRPSKNAPEFRDYTESDTYENSKYLSEKALELVKKWTN